MMTTRWHVWETSGRMWVLMMMVWSPASSVISRRVSMICLGSSPAVGSSRISTSGLWSRAWARPTRCRYPFDRVPQYRSAMSVMLVRAMAAPICAARSPAATPLMRATNCRYSPTVISGYSGGVSGRYPVRRLASIGWSKTSKPATRARPSVAGR